MKNQWLILLLVPIPLAYSLSITSGSDQGQDCFIITTTIATYSYQKSAGAFSSIQDMNGLDWIDYNTNNGIDPSSALRGLPGLAYSDSIGHPGFSSCSSVQEGDTSIVTSSNDGAWEWRWDFSECQAKMTITRAPAGGTYTFGYNGPPSDKYGPGTYWGAEGIGLQRNNGRYGRRDTTASFQWAYVGDTTKNRIFFIGQMIKDSLTDSYKRLDGAVNDGMLSIKFGNDGSSDLMSAVNNSFVIGFLEQKVYDSITHKQAAAAIEALLYTGTPLPLYGISVTTHWQGEGQAIQGGWGNIIRHDIENDSITNNTALYTGKAYYPKINLEGTQVTFFTLNDTKKGATVAVVDIDGDNFRKLENTKWTDGGNAGYLDWPAGRWIYYLPVIGDGNQMYRVHVDSGTVEKVFSFETTSGEPTHPWIWTMNADGSRMTFRASDFHIYFVNVPTVFPKVIVLDPAGGVYNSKTDIYGCQHSISSSGNYICYGPPVDMHATIRIKQWDDGTRYGCLRKYTAPQLHSWPPSQTSMGSEFYHNHWANNSDYWICAHEISSSGTYEVCNQVLYNWLEKRQVVVTNNTGQTPDFDCAGDFWIDTSNSAGLPIIRLNKTELYFEADSGFANPDSQEVAVTNSSAGVLADVQTSINYTAGDTTGWLRAYKSAGGGNTQTITNSVDITGLTGGNYRAIVTVSAANATVSKIYSVLLKVDATRVFSSVQIYPEDVTMEPGDTCLFVAFAMDQYNDTLSAQPAKWIWRTDSNATIFYGLFTSSITSSLPYKIYATGTVGAITLSDTTHATVEFPMLKILSPNGGENLKIADITHIKWESADTSKISTVALELSLDNGKTWHLLDSSAISPHDPRWGNYQWIIPDSIGAFEDAIVPISENCKIKIRDYQFPLYRDVSDSIFTIRPGPTAAEKQLQKHGIQKFGILQINSHSFKVLIPPVSRYTIDIVSVNGRTVLSKKGTGSCIYTVTGKHLAAGVYLIRARADKKMLTRRLLLY